MQLEEAQRLLFPSINSIIVNKDFIGLGHKLEDRRRERRHIDEEAKSLENRVLFLEKQHKYTNKEIEKKQEKLEQLLNTKRRQEEERQEKERNRQQKEEELERLRRLGELQRMEHRLNLNECMSGIYQYNRSEAMSGKQDQKRRESAKMIQQSRELQSKQELYGLVHEQRHEGKLNVIQFRRERNREHIQDYHLRIQNEEQNKLKKLAMMQALEQREFHLIDKLQKSSQLHQQLQDKLQKAQQADVKQLESMVLSSHRKPATVRSLNSSLTEDKIDTGSTRQQRSRLDLDNYRRKLSQISHTIDVLDKPHMLEIMYNNHEDLSPEVKSPNQSKKKRRKRHRRYHPE